MSGTKNMTLFFAIVALTSGLLVLSLANAGEAFHSEGHNAYVLAVDPSSGSVDVRVYETEISSAIRTEGDISLNTDQMTDVTMCNEPKSLEDIREGDTLSVVFHETDSQYFADSIMIEAAPGEEC